MIIANQQFLQKLPCAFSKSIFLLVFIQYFQTPLLNLIHVNMSFACARSGTILEIVQRKMSALKINGKGQTHVSHQCFDDVRMLFNTHAVNLLGARNVKIFF